MANHESSNDDLLDYTTNSPASEKEAVPTPTPTTVAAEGHVWALRAKQSIDGWLCQGFAGTLHPSK
jgi:hypothetical protein